MITLDFEDANPALAAYNEIKRRIVELEYEPGEKLSEARLTTELGVGRSPVRTALARLRGEGWVFVSPQSGTYVKAPTNRDIEQVTELRILLEMHAAGTAAGRIGTGELDVLRAAFSTYGPNIAKGDVEAFIRVDNMLHNAIYKAADNDLVAGILINLRDKVQWIRRVCAVSPDRVQDGFRELNEILSALEGRDAHEAAERMRAHIHRAAAFCRMRDWSVAADGEGAGTPDQVESEPAQADARRFGRNVEQAS